MSSIVKNPLAAIANPTVALNASIPGVSDIASGIGGFDLQNALGTRNNFQAQMAPGTLEALKAGQGNLNSATTGQNALIAQLQAQANGQGPNPAQAMLNQATNNNIAQNTGMIASTKGINPALAARQASMNAANMNQQAAGQGAIMNAQQQLNAQNAQAGVLNNMATQALNQQNIAQEGFYAPQNINAGVSAGNAKTNAQLTGGLMQSAGQAAMMMAAHGGMVPQYAGGGMISNPSLDPVSNAASFFHEQNNQDVKMPNSSPMMRKPSAEEPAVPTPATGGGATGVGQAAMPFYQGGMSMKPGGQVPGQGQVSGDSYSNDTVPAMLSPKEIVIPRSITMGKNPGEEAKKFVEAELAKHGKAKGAYAEGGAVVPDYLQPNSLENSPINRAIDSGIMDAQAGIDISNAPSKEDVFNQRVGEYAKANNVDISNPSLKQGVEEYVLGQMKKDDTAKAWENEDAQKRAQFEAEKANVLGIAPTAPAQLSQEIPQQITPQATPNPMNDYMSSMNKSLGMEQAAIGKQAEGERQLAQGQLGVLQKQQEDLQRVQADYDQRYNAINDETQKAAKDLAEGKIDPKHYWNEKSAMGKVSSVIGLILGGIGSGLTGQENAAAKYMNNMIDKDIQAQTAEMDKKKNLMSFNMRRLGDLRAAQAATAAMHLQSFQNQLLQETAKSQDPLIQARAMQANAQIERKKADYQRQATIYSAMASGQGNNQGSQTLQYMRMVDPQRAKEMEKRFIPGVGFGSVEIPDKVREEVAGRHELEHGIQKLMKFAKEHQGSMNPATIKEGEALANQVQDAYRRANGQGVFREAEADFVKGVIADNPTAFFAKMRTLPKYKAALQMNKAALNSKLQAYGFAPTRDLSKMEGAPVR
jgi:hypothetical protein